MLKNSTIKEELNKRKVIVEDYLKKVLEGRYIPARLKQAMLYSLEAGGKRLRPILCISCAKLFGQTEENVVPFAGALEMIHTYSLIHDDLPAMDNDDLRRGKPSNHKAFDEATAILAGDALLTDSFVIMSRTHVACDALIKAIEEIALAAGASGMVGGQELDFVYTGQKNITFDALKQMQALKTGSLLCASCVCGAYLAGASIEQVKQIRIFGQELGAAFQIADDILDSLSDTATLGKPAGSDVKQGKITYLTMLGLTKSREKASEHVKRAKASLDAFSGEEISFLCALADYTIERTS